MKVPAIPARVGSTVLLLGLTSMFTDISSEMVNSILPIYLTTHLGFSPLQFGVFDGLYHGSAALARIGSGFFADRSQKHKEVAALGYGLSAVCKLALWLAGSLWSLILAVLLLDRTGKAIRTPPRDALISLSAPTTKLGEAFGVHRALDTTGAFLGPLISFALLAAMPPAYDVVFVTSFFVAIIGLGILLFFVENIRTDSPTYSAKAAAKPSSAAIFHLLSERRFSAILMAGVALNFVTLSDGFVYLTLQRGGPVQASAFPLLYVGTALVYLLLAIPAGRLADRMGRPITFLAGHGFILLLYALLLYAQLGLATIMFSLLLFGAYYAATDGVLMGIASPALPAESRTIGLALLTTATALARLAGSFLYGALWTWQGPARAMTIFLIALIAGVIYAARLCYCRIMR